MVAPAQLQGNSLIEAVVFIIMFKGLLLVSGVGLIEFCGIRCKTFLKSAV